MININTLFLILSGLLILDYLAICYGRGGLVNPLEIIFIKPKSRIKED